MSLLSPQIQAFLAITDAKTVHGAADTLNLTQTAVTQRIRTLEGQLGTSLFVRTRRGMMLTEEGEALLRYCRANKALEDEALSVIKGAAIEAPIRITITGATSIMGSRIIPQCLPVMKQFPNLLLHFDITDSNRGIENLRTGKSQFTIIQQEQITREMQHKILNPEKYVLVCSSQWKNRPLKQIIQKEKIIDFDPADQMTYAYLKQYNLYEHAQHERHFVNRTESMAMMITQGLGYGVLTKEVTEPYIKNQKLIILNQGKIHQNSQALVWFSRPQAPKYFTDIIDAIS